MKTLLFAGMLVCFSPILRLRAELPPEIKPRADMFDEAMKGYKGNVEAIVMEAQRRYRVALEAARRWEEGGKRKEGVAAIDSELAALEAGTLPESPPAKLPDDPILTRSRKECINAPEKAEKAVAGPRKFARDSYVEWLEGMGAIAKRADNAELVAAIAAEIERVKADAAGDGGETPKENGKDS